MPLRKPTQPSPRWSTSSFGTSPDISAKDLAMLGAHMLRCDEGRGHFFAARCVGESLARFAAPRLFSILLLLILASILLS